MLSFDLMTSHEKQIFKQTVEILSKTLHPSRIVLFGSRAKGKASLSSDFDFAVECKKRNRSLRERAKDLIEAVSGLYKVDIVYFDELDKKFREIILSTGKVIYEKRA